MKIKTFQSTNENDINNVVLEQSSENLILAIAILSEIIFLVFAIIYISYLELWGWWMIIAASIFFVLFCIRLYLRLFKIPLRIELDNNTLTISMYFGKKFNLNISDIENIRYSKLLSLFAKSGGWLNCSPYRCKFIIGKPFYKNFDELINYLRQINPNCEIDDELIKWPGAKKISP